MFASVGKKRAPSDDSVRGRAETLIMKLEESSLLTLMNYLLKLRCDALPRVS